MTQNKIIASIIGTFSIGILFVIMFLIYASFSPLAEGNPQAQAVLESGQEATQTAFNWWLVVDTIGGIIIFGGLIFGVIKLAMKIAEKESGFDSRGYYL